jgi:hypothetical protein
MNGNNVMRGLDPRTYPLRRLDGVGAPMRVGPRNESAGDGGLGMGT